MEIESSSLYREIEAIVRGSALPVHYSIAADIHAHGETFRVLKVLSVDTLRDFELNYADEVIVEVVIAGGTFAKRIYPFQNNLDITLYKLPLAEVGDFVDQETPMQAERYTATLLDVGNVVMEANGANSPTEDALNLTNLFQVKFQLVNKALEQLRMITVGGVYRYATTEDVVKALLTQASQSVKVDGIRMPQGVDMIPATNQAPREHVILPHGTRLVDVPQYVQNKCGGIYSAGLGYYLQGDYWYLYPCFDTRRFNQSGRTLTIINVPANKFPGIERTYRNDGGNLVVLATGEVRTTDDSEVQQLNAGNGVRFADARNFMQGFSVTEGNRTTINRGSNNNEFISSERENGNNNVRISETPINANAFVEYSKLARREGSFVSLVWENSFPAAIFPGMMVKVLYLDEDEIKEVDGVVLKSHDYTHLKGEGATASAYRTNTTLAVFVKRTVEI